MRRGIYLLPSFLTVANMLCGFYAVMSTLKGGFADLDNAAKAIGLAILFDSFDGFVARATGTSSEFGKQFDSLADMVSFGIAPAVLAFTWGVHGISESEMFDIRRIHEIGWWVGLSLRDLLRLAAGAVQHSGNGARRRVALLRRLAVSRRRRLDCGERARHQDRRSKIGAGRSFGWWSLASAAALMASTVKYRSFKDVPMARRQPSLMIILIALLVWLIVFYSEVVLMLIATVYVASGLTLHVVRVVRHRLVSHPA